MLTTGHIAQIMIASRRFAVGTAGLWVLSAMVLALASVSPASAAEPTDAELQLRPATIEEGDTFTDRDGRRLLLKQAILERALEEGSTDFRQLEKLLGAHRLRKLDQARFMLDLNAEHLGRDARDDPRFEDAKDAVFSAWKKIQRERLEERLGIEAWWQKRRSGLRRGQGDSDPQPMWRLRVSPRLSDDAVGVKLGMRGTGTFLDHTTFRFTYEVEDSHPVFLLKFEDRLRFFDFVYEPDTVEHGDRLGISLRYSW